MFDLNQLVQIKAKLLDERKPADALKVAVFASQEFPGSPLAWCELADAYLRAGNTQGAHVAVERCLAIAPRDARALALRNEIREATRPHFPAPAEKPADCGCGSGRPDCC